MRSQEKIKENVTILFVFCCLVLPLMNSVSSSENQTTITKETIKNKIVGLNGFSWQYGFDIEMVKQIIYVSVSINLVPGPGVSMVELSKVKPGWKKGIERIWSDKYLLKTKSGVTYPIKVNVHFRGPKFNHSVIVRPGIGHSDQLNWNIKDSEQIVSHEFGHMIGAYDEYKRGANNPNKPVIDKTSIMTSNPKTGQSYGRHFQKVRSWFISKGHEDSAQVTLFSIR